MKMIPVIIFIFSFNKFLYLPSQKFSAKNNERSILFFRFNETLIFKRPFPTLRYPISVSRF